MNQENNFEWPEINKDWSLQILSRISGKNQALENVKDKNHV